MSSKHPVPDKASVLGMLGMLFGDGLKVEPLNTPCDTDVDSNVVAVYVADDDAPSSACVCDISFAAFAGAALSMIPKGGAEDAAESGELSEIMLGNLHEVMNICSRLFMNDSSPHLRLDAVHKNAGELPDAARDMVAEPTARSDFRVVIPGYGDGNLSFLSI